MVTRPLIPSHLLRLEPRGQLMTVGVSAAGAPLNVDGLGFGGGGS